MLSNKRNLQTTLGVKIYPIDYLMNNELNESDLTHLFNTKSLLYSIVIGMYREIGSKKRNCDIIKDCRKNNKWLSSHKWTIEQFCTFEDKLTKIMKNLYWVNDDTARSKAQWMMIQYGFLVNK